MKKTKSKSNSSSSFKGALVLAGIIFSIVAITMFFVNFVKDNTSVIGPIEGFKLAFGYTKTQTTTLLGITTTTTLYTIPVIPLVLIGFILVAVALLGGLISFFAKGNIGKIVLGASALCLVVAAVFFFICNINYAGVKEIEDTSKVGLEIGAILAGSYSAAGAVSFIGAALLK